MKTQTLNIGKRKSNNLFGEINNKKGNFYITPNINILTKQN